MKHLSIKNKKGFTLVEFLIATVILGVGLLALINLQWSAIRGNSDSKEMTRAIFLAEKKMEQLKNTPYYSLTIGTTQDNNPMDGMENPGGIFSRSWTIQKYMSSNYLKQVTVNVSWNLKGQNHTVTNSTVMTGKWL